MNKQPRNDTTWPPRREPTPGRHRRRMSAVTRRAATAAWDEVSGVRPIPRPDGPRERRWLVAAALVLLLGSALAVGLAQASWFPEVVNVMAP